MTMEKEGLPEKEKVATDPATGETCADIQDPVRRSLCKVCNMPVVGEAPFCKDHEPPIP
jgi:hypothetical protein